MASVPEGTLEDVLPFREVEKRSFGVCLHERVPCRAIRQCELTHTDAVDRHAGSGLGCALLIQPRILHVSRSR
jgi:hypothetical protein